MNKLLQHSLAAIATIILSASSSPAQYNINSLQCESGRCRLRDTPSQYPLQQERSFLNDLAGSSYDLRDDVRHRYDTEISRLRSGYDYRAPLNSAVEDSFRRPLREEPRYRDYGRDYQTRYPLPDPFSTRDDFGPRGRSFLRYRPLDNRSKDDSCEYQSRYRIPYRNTNYGASHRDLPLSLTQPLEDVRQDQWDRFDDRYSGSDSFDHRRSTPQLDPFTPALPPREAGSETDAIMKAISSRYGNPVTVRAAQSMTASQALSLFREVSQQTDQRHLEPSSYDLRVRRGIRNLGLALDNRSFTTALGVSSDSFRVDGFRSALTEIAQDMRVANYSDAQSVVQRVMREADRVQGLSASIVAFEFTNATVDTLDKFSALEPAEPGRGASLDLELTERVRSAGLESEIVGIGVEVKGHDDGLLIMKPLRGGPAAEAGLKSGDIITAIDGRSIRGMRMANSVDLMKGRSGSQIRLQVARNGREFRPVTLVRRTVRVYTVNDVKILPGSEKVAYMSLSQFGQKSTEELDQALMQLHNRGMKSLILDLRGNPGGLLNVCVDITNRFLPCGTIVSTKGRLSSDNMQETASFERTWSTPLVVLIDGDSASASEIFAAAVQENRRGIVVGEKSYGKGTVQTHFPLSSVRGNLRLTTARFYSPNGRPMSGEGVRPDVRIADSDGPANGDRVLEEATVIAGSQRLKDIADAAKKCRPNQGRSLPRNSFRGNDISDSVAPKTVLR